jgi:hypothetical protein
MIWWLSGIKWCKLEEVKRHMPIAVAERSEAWTVFDRSEAVIVGSNPALPVDV